MPRPSRALVIVRKELGLVCRHVDIQRAISLTALAREAEIQRLKYGFALPAVFDYIAGHHLPEHMRAAAGRVLFFHRGAIARAHDAVFMSPALADSDATQRGIREIPAVAHEMEMRLRRRRIVI